MMICLCYASVFIILCEFQVSSIASSLSTRQLIRVARRLAQFPDEDLYGIIQKACLARYTRLLLHTKLANTI